MTLLLPWLLPGSAGRPDHSDQTHPRHLDNLAEVASQTSTSFRNRDIPTTLPDIGSDPGDDVVPLDVPREWTSPFSSRRAVAGGNDWVDRRPVTCGALRVFEDEILRDRSTFERHAEVAYRYADALDDLERVVRRLPRLEDYRVLSERLLAVEQANTSLQTMVGRLVPLEMEIAALRAHNQILLQFLGGRGP
ncbi:uncharacterized protein PHALS_09692 [Plasmopara halstedii]|uniref:Uncharacterized protein n=1 Tax=Plasmopara halstedii TaxID=4781 RepID=A0A0P1AG61_PLAHL|nr:uncharacterized protein PHALS_09692 [Plasmopara halstedii]CEG39446.1 hypothetical protein PHALS_09692 [Plasmopara halstedii]|eukprot:XP_024575815.1 hypothetical protein PHALS_09692 [Plasmopara halstedii]